MMPLSTIKVNYGFGVAVAVVAGYFVAIETIGVNFVNGAWFVRLMWFVYLKWFMLLK